MVRSGVVQEYDYGRLANHKHYNGDKPAPYDYGKCEAEVGGRIAGIRLLKTRVFQIHIFWSPKDILAGL